MTKHLLIDSNSIGFACQSTNPLTAAGMEVQAIFGFVKAVRGLLTMYPGYRPICLWDGRAQWRFDLHPGYKADRDKDPKQAEIRVKYKAARPHIHRCLHALGIDQMTVLSHEADDMAGYLVQKLAPTAEHIELVSGDKDWIQLVNTNVAWFDPIRDRRCNLNNLMDFTGYATPHAFLQGKALQGDLSDKISGVGGIGEKGAPVFLAQYGSVEHFWELMDAGKIDKPSKAESSLWAGRSPLNRDAHAALLVRPAGMEDPAWAKQLQAHMQTWPGQGRMLFERNMKLMDLLNVPKPDKSAVKIVRGSRDLDRFLNLCGEFAFASIRRDFNEWTRPFLGLAA